MLRIRGTTYHFRRIVPSTLRAILNRREIWVSLKTGYQNEAHKRASLLHTRTLELFMHAHSMLAEPDALSGLGNYLVSLRDLLSVNLPSSTQKTKSVPASIPMTKPQRQHK